MKLLFCWLSLLAFAATAKAGDTTVQRRLPALCPDFVLVQFAGHTGLLSIGLGYDLAHDRLHLALLDGYVPPSVSKAGGINTISLRLSGDVARLRFGKQVELRPYAGLSALFETTGHGFYARLPDRYRDRHYYRNSAVHGRCFAGARIILKQAKGLVRALSLYGETGTLDSYLYYNLHNGGQHFTEIFTAALGITVGI